MAASQFTATITVNYWRPILRPLALWRRYRELRRDGNEWLIAVAGAWVITSAKVE